MSRARNFIYRSETLERVGAALHQDVWICLRRLHLITGLTSERIRQLVNRLIAAGYVEVKKASAIYVGPGKCSFTGFRRINVYRLVKPLPYADHIPRVWKVVRR